MAFRVEKEEYVNRTFRFSKKLLAQMEASGAPPTCPHGRPVIKTFSRREIERMFKRIQ